MLCWRDGCGCCGLRCFITATVGGTSYVLVRVGVVVIAVIGMLELTDEIFLVGGCCSWSRACACDVVIVDWVFTVE